MKYEFETLEKMTIKDLETIKEVKQNELYEIKKGKYVLISNIISLQEIIQSEVEKLNR